MKIIPFDFHPLKSFVSVSAILFLAILFPNCSSPTDDNSDTPTSQYRILFTNRTITPEAIFSINEDGTDMKQHTLITGWWPVWSPDASKIVFYSTAGFDIYRINYDGENLINLTNHPGHDSQPDISPDGEWVTFSSDRNGNLDIFIIKIDGSNLTQLSMDDEDESHPVWSHDGQKILYKRGSNDLMIMDDDGSNTIEITVQEAALGFDDHSWLNNDAQIVYNQEGKIYIANANGVGQNLISDSTKNAWYPNYSSANSTVVFVYRDGAEGEMWEVNIDGTNHRKLISLEGDLSQPKYSPDGKSIVFNDDVNSSLNQMYIIDSDGTNRRKVTSENDEDYQFYFSWSPIRFEN